MTNPTNPNKRAVDLEALADVGRPAAAPGVLSCG
jgi:hypothetical protein